MYNKNILKMKRKHLSAVFAAILAMAAVPQNADAQLGKILGKVKKVAEKVIDTPANAAKSESSTTATAASAVTQADGVIVENPMAAHYDVQLVGAYGKSTSQNYGEVFLVVKVKMIDNETVLRFGGNVQLPVMAVDTDGNQYSPKESAGFYDKQVTEGMYVKINLGDLKSCTFKDVKKTATKMQMIRIGTSLSYTLKGLVTFKNVPIQWDVVPE